MAQLTGSRCTRCLSEDGELLELHVSASSHCRTQGHKVCNACWLLISGEEPVDRHFCGLWERYCLHDKNKVGYAAEAGGGGGGGRALARVMSSAQTQLFPWQKYGTSDLTEWKGHPFVMPPPKKKGGSEWGPVWNNFAWLGDGPLPTAWKKCNVICLVRNAGGEPCGRMLTRPAKDGSTSAMVKHLEAKHKATHAKWSGESTRSKASLQQQDDAMNAALELGGPAPSTDPGKCPKVMPLR